MNITGDIYKNIFEHAITGLALADKKGRIIAANVAFCRFTKYKCRDIVNSRITFESIIYEEDRDLIKSVFRNFLESKTFNDKIYEFRLVRRDSEIVTIVATFFFDKESGYFIIHIHDISERKKIVNDILLRDKILEAINFASRQFLKSNSWEKVMPGVLEALGKATGVARTYCFENTTDENTNTLLMNERFEWAYDKSASQITNPRMQGLSYEKAGILRWKDEMEKGNIIIADIGSVEPDEKRNMEHLGTKTSVITPIFINDKWWGFIGFDETREDRKWTEAEIDALGAAAGIIGSAMFRQEVREALIAYITESTLRIKEPVNLVRDNIVQIKKDILENKISEESIGAKIDIQIKNIDQINKNLKDISRAIVENRSEIPDAYRRFISH
ncbi:PAS domain S-box-containing protein [Methanomicrobium sp. W14]|uniref:PAS domain S-box protein n=1 Tax=Methanomicrobium sp. W14 TaxID=2817839 RepID=UPI001AEB0DE5|nr:PAS domain S-box protein [Methanomicrobium sp. W14]MBP2133338.1 PAS domain S-box-containing protein [Methanomicrobium sp. W14]